MLKNSNSGLYVFLALVLGFLCALLSYRYISQGNELSQVLLPFYFLFGFLNFAVLFLVTFFPSIILSMLSFGKVAIVLAWIISFAGLVFLVTDTFVFQQFRMHLNYAMLEMALLGGGQIVKFSSQASNQILLLVLLCACFASLALLCSFYLRKKTRLSSIAFFTLVISYAGANVLHGFAWAKHYYPVVAVSYFLPVAKPLTFNKLLVRSGVFTAREVYTPPVKFRKDSLMIYPLNPLVFDKNITKPLNLVFIFVDSLRADMLAPETMPTTWEFAQKGVIFKDHMSGGINTRHGIFTLFTGIPGSYWQKALVSKTGSPLITALINNNYDIGIFAGAPLNMPEFNQTIFKSVPNLRVFPPGKDAIERDKLAVEDFQSWLKSVPKGRRFFSFVFLDNVHASAFPAGSKFEHFKPFLKEVNHLALNNTFDPKPYFNRYKNSVLFADYNIGKIIKCLSELGLMKDTIIIIGSDHGEEFNDNGLNYWGHNGNFTQYQAKVPLVVYWPGKGVREINYRTSMLDIVPTILPEVLGVINPVSDYSVGQSIWEPNRKRDWVYSSNYSRNAFIEKDRIVLIDELGLLRYLDNSYGPSKDKTVPSYINEVLEENRRYLK